MGYIVFGILATVGSCILGVAALESAEISLLWIGLGVAIVGKIAIIGGIVSRVKAIRALNRLKRERRLGSTGNIPNLADQPAAGSSLASWSLSVPVLSIQF